MRRVERARNWGLWLTAAACAAGLLGAMPAREATAQEASTAQADELAAETAYLRAYFTEKETKDLAAAERAYAAILGMRGVTPDLAVRVRLGRVRCLHGLRRGDEARAALAAATAAAKDGSALAATTRDALTAATDLLNVKPNDEPATLEERIDAALRSGDLKTTVLPFGDRALSHLRNILLTSDDATLSSRAASAITTMDTDASRKHVKALMSQYDSLRFPREFAVAVARAMPFDVVAELAAPLPVETRRAMWTAALRTVRPFTDADARRILADRDARPAPDEEPNAGVAHARYLLRALIDEDAAFRASAERAVRRRAWGTSAEMVDAWFDAPAEVLADLAARRTLIENVYANVNWESATIAPEVLRAIASDPDGARLYLRACTQQARGAQNLADRTAFRAAAAHAPPSFGGNRLNPTQWFVRVFEAAGLTEPDGLRWALANWRAEPALGDVLALCPSIVAPSPAQVAELLDPATPPTILAKVMGLWLQGEAFLQSAGAPAAVPRLVSLLTHKDESVRSFAWRCLARNHAAGRTPADIDVVAIARAPLSPDLRLPLLRSLPPAALQALFPEIRADSESLETILAALVYIEDPEIERRLAEIVASTSRASVALTATTNLVWRAKGAADAAIAELITDPARSTALRSEVALGCLRSIDPLETARSQRFLDAIFARTPVPLGLGENKTVQAAVSRLNAVARRRLALAALASSSDSDRRFGADLARELRDSAAWDRLVVLAEDPEPTVRDAARAALDAIAEEEDAVRRYRRVAATKKTRDEIPALLASASAEDRLAGIAAVVAIEDDSQTAELLRLATKDAAEPVRQAARRALETLGDRRVTAREAAGRQEQPTKPALEETPK